MEISEALQGVLNRIKDRSEESTFKGKGGRSYYMSLFMPHLEPERKQENWKRYVAWCKKNKVSHSEDAVAKFKKTQWNKKMPYGERCLPAITGSYLGYRLAHVKTHELYPFYKKCLEARNFSEWFFGRLKVK